MPEGAWHIVQILFWLSISTWFGGVLFVAVMAPVIIRAVREDNPILTSVLSVNLEGQHSTLLGGSIVGKIVALLLRIELACAIALCVAIAGQVWLLHPTGGQLAFTLLRVVLYLAAVAMLIYHTRVVWPAVLRNRREYIDHADEPDIANPALDRFDHYQRENVTVLFTRVGILLALILLSADVIPIIVAVK